ncbi:helix-turn-helix transcriptional regulator [Pseudomonas eucalypticola]|nr:helix-turn-helix transcriptional regulator [Pseudomonas eucalypticola]
MNLATKSQFALQDRTQLSTTEQSTIAQAGSSAFTVTAIEVKLVSSSLATAHTDFDDFMTELEADSSNSDSFIKAGNWIAETFYGEDGLTLKTARLRRGLSQKQLAEMTGLTQPYISTIEKNGADVLLSTANKICIALDIPLENLTSMMERQRNINIKDKP